MIHIVLGQYSRCLFNLEDLVVDPVQVKLLVDVIRWPWFVLKTVEEGLQ